MSVLICIGSNSRLIQQCLLFSSRYSTIHLFSRNSYKGIVVGGSIHHLVVDPLLILLKIKAISEELSQFETIDIVYSSFHTDRNSVPNDDQIWDPGFSMSLQSLVINKENISRLAILGSTQALFYPLSKDFYLTFKKLELVGFLIYAPIDLKCKVCYIALPPLDESNHFLGRFFKKSRFECASVIMQALNSRSRLLSPYFVYYLISTILFFRIVKTVSY